MFCKARLLSAIFAGWPRPHHFRKSSSDEQSPAFFPIIDKTWRPQSRSLCGAARAVLEVFAISRQLSRNRTRRKQNEQASAWWNAVDGLAAVHAHLKKGSNLVQECY